LDDLAFPKQITHFNLGCDLGMATDANLVSVGEHEILIRMNLMEEIEDAGLLVLKTVYRGRSTGGSQ
jgi:hypothetical protein